LEVGTKQSATENHEAAEQGQPIHGSEFTITWYG
jgi:hypothetical protein